MPVGVDSAFFVEETRAKITTVENAAQGRNFDMRQNICWSFFSDPTSETFNNATASAIKAGYAPSHANNIMSSPWFKARVRALGIFEKSVRVLDEMLDMPVKTEKVVGLGDDAETVVKTDPALVKIKQDTAKFVAARRGKDEGWSDRTEITGKNGAPLGLSQLFEAAARPVETPPAEIGSSFAEFHEIPSDSSNAAG